MAPEPTSAELAQFWSACDIRGLNLFDGPTKLDSRPPDTARPFMFVSQKTTGFIPSYDVRDAAGREWSVKLGAEAQSEVVVSRLLWAIGYRQPPIYYVDQWTLEGGPDPGLQRGARFRPKDESLKSDGPWSWQHNPFVETQPYRGLIVAMAILDSTDSDFDGDQSDYWANRHVPQALHAVWSVPGHVVGAFNWMN